jgi:hypothetical protein
MEKRRKGVKPRLKDVGLRWAVTGLYSSLRNFLPEDI